MQHAGNGLTCHTCTTQSCSEVSFGSCTLNTSRRTGNCRDCFQGPALHGPVHATRAVAQPEQFIYLMVLVPPFSGSTALEALLASSPSTTTICKTGVWQCEYQLAIEKWGIWPRGWNQARRYTALEDFDPPMDPLEYWGPVFRALENHNGYDWPHRSIRVLKTPSDLAKVKSLAQYFRLNDLDYRIILMHQHPCLLTTSHDKYTRLSAYARYFDDVVRYVPADRRFVFAYEDLLTSTVSFLQRLLEWLPELLSLDPGKGLPASSSGHDGERHESLVAYTTSQTCGRTIQRESALRYPADVEASTVSV